MVASSIQKLQQISRVLPRFSERSAFVYKSMASTLPPRTWKNGYIQPTNKATWEDDTYYNTYDGDKAHYEKPKAEGPSTSDAHNALGRCVLRTWPTIHNGTNSPEGAPAWWIPAKEVDVLICGGEPLRIELDRMTEASTGGPFGLQVAMCLARQGISFRIVGTYDLLRHSSLAIDSHIIPSADGL